LILTTILSDSVAKASEDLVIPLKLIHALPVEGPENNQPSGLTIWHDTLFAVSDKHDDTIFRVALTDTNAVFVPHLTFAIPESAPGLLVCAERQPRGLIEVDRSVEPFAVRVFNTDETSLNLPAGRSADFSDLFRENGDLLVLQRNAEIISSLIYGGPVLEEKDLWSFGHIVNREDLRYSNIKYGLAEGFCMDAKRIYLILDNNGDCRASDPDDRRPLLLIMERP